MRVQVDHHSTKEAAKQKIDSEATKLLEGFGSQLSNVAQSWTDDTMSLSFTAYNFNLRGQIEVTASQVIVEVGLPPLAQLFEGQATQAIEGKLTKFFPE